MTLNSYIVFNIYGKSLNPKLEGRDRIAQVFLRDLANQIVIAAVRSGQWYEVCIEEKKYDYDKKDLC